MAQARKAQRSDGGGDFALEGAQLTQPADFADLIPPGGRIVVHIIPQAHIDLAWMWTADDGRQMVLSTFRRHVEVLERNPGYTFAQGQLAAYRMVEEFDPPLFARIRRLVRRGQWEVVGGQWVEPDHAIPSGEAQVRQLLRGQHYAREKFGTQARVAWCPDSFIGQPASLVDLFLDAGLEALVFKRPREKLISLPETPFWWVSPSGQRLLAFRSNNKGAGWPSLSEGSTGGLARIGREFAELGIDEFWGPLGCGDVGGLNRYYTPGRGKGWRQVYDTPSGYFARLRTKPLDRLPRLARDLGPIMLGALTTHVEMKYLNRRAECALQQAEFAAALELLVTGQDSPKERDALRRAWDKVLFNQFHDIVPGTGYAHVHAEAAEDYREATRAAGEVCRRAGYRIAQAVPVDPAGGCQVVILNSLGPGRTAWVEGELNLGVTPAEAEGRDWRAVDPAGRKSPIHLELVKNAQNRWFRWRAGFLAKNLPALGWRTYRIVPKSGRGKSAAPVVRRRGWEFDTGALRVRFDSRTGQIRSLALCSGRGRIAVGPLGGWRIFEEGKYGLDYGQEMRAWYLGLTGRSFVPRRASLTCAPAVGGWRVTAAHTFGRSRFEQEFTLRAGEVGLDVRVTVDWQETEMLARLMFDVAGLGHPLTGWRDGPFQVAELPASGTEYPMQTFCAVAGRTGGLIVANDGRYGTSFEGRSLSISVVRCATYPDPISDRGRYEFRYRLAPYAGGWRPERAWAEAAGFNRPPWLVQGDGGWQKADLPREGSAVAYPSGAVQAVALKPAETGRGAILRLFNPTGRAERLTVKAARRLRTVNILEDPTGPARAGRQALTVKPRSIAALRIEPSRGRSGSQRPSR